MKLKILFIFVFLVNSTVGILRGTNLRILNGDLIEYQPYYAYITTTIGYPLFGNGGGAFITRRHVLTIGSLIKYASAWNIHYGSMDYASTDIVTSRVAFIHPEYLSEADRKNIGVIVLPQPIMSEFVQPIALPIPAIDMVLPRTFEEGMIVGFSTNFITESPALTSSLRGAFYQVDANNEPCRNEDLFCARDTVFESSICLIDRGAPFVTTLRGQQILTGLVAVLPNIIECNARNQVAFVKIQPLLEWIKIVANI